MSVIRFGEALPVAVQADARSWRWAIRGREGGRRGHVVRVAVNLAAFVSLLAAASLWALPGSMTGGEVLPMKAGATVLLVVTGIYLLRLRIVFDAPELQIDHENREVRIIHRTYRSDVLRAVYTFGELEWMEIVGHALHLRRTDGTRCAALDLGRRL